jgi:hypothetical protein
MFKKLFIGLIVIGLLGVAWLFYQYQKTAGAADEQVEKDLHELRMVYDEKLENKSGVFLDVEHHGKIFLDRKLVNQSINEQRKYVRHYHGLYLREGLKSCLKTQVVYPNRKAVILSEKWTRLTKNCLP